MGKDAALVVRTADIASEAQPDTDNSRSQLQVLPSGVLRAMRSGMPRFTPLENAFTDTLMDLHALRRTDIDLPELRHHTNEIDFAVGRLCEVLAQPTEEDMRELAHRAHRGVLGLAQLLDSADSEDRRTRDKLDLARAAVAALLDELEPLVSGADRALRDVLLRGASLDDAFRRVRER